AAVAKGANAVDRQAIAASKASGPVADQPLAACSMALTPNTSTGTYMGSTRNTINKPPRPSDTVNAAPRAPSWANVMVPKSIASTSTPEACEGKYSNIPSTSDN